jgi:transposase
MARRKRRQYTEEFRADSVRLVTSGAMTIAEVRDKFDLTETSLRGWLKRAEVEAGPSPIDTLTTAERAELAELRTRVKRLTMERDILKKATAFFAKENA